MGVLAPITGRPSGSRGIRRGNAWRKETGTHRAWMTGCAFLRRVSEGPEAASCWLVTASPARSLPTGRAAARVAWSPRPCWSRQRMSTEAGSRRSSEASAPCRLSDCLSGRGSWRVPTTRIARSLARAPSRLHGALDFSAPVRPDTSTSHLVTATGARGRPCWSESSTLRLSLVVPPAAKEDAGRPVRAAWQPSISVVPDVTP